MPKGRLKNLSKTEKINGPILLGQHSYVQMRKAYKKQLSRESKITSADSMEILAEFEKL